MHSFAWRPCIFLRATALPTLLASLALACNRIETSAGDLGKVAGATLTPTPAAHAHSVGESATLPPGPTPTCVPTKAAEKSELHITFTGVLTFKKTEQGFYRVIFPKSPEHIAYIRYAKGDLRPSSIPKPLPTPTYGASQCCGGEQEAFEIKNHKISVPRVGGSITALGKVGEHLVPLRVLAEGDDFNKDDFDLPNPKDQKVAAQMDLPEGDLEPRFDEGDYEWYFETKGPTNPVRSPEKPRCLAQGVVLKLRNLQGDRVSLEAKKTGGGTYRLTLGLRGTGPTEVTIGNSLRKDVFCPGGSSSDTDEHFENQYLMLKNGGSHKYVPKRNTLEKCKRFFPGDLKTIRGSNCLGSQWP